MGFRSWLFSPVTTLICAVGRTIMDSINNLVVIATKLRADVDIRLAADAQALADKDTVIAAKDLQITDLQTQLAAFQNDAATIDGVVATLTDADAALVPPAPAPAPETPVA